ncbi:MAG: hypothetical protein AB1582_12160 [Pseudomonadota bacterium]
MTIEPIAAVSGETNAAAFSERARISAILESPEGKRNPELAAELALRSPLDVENAKSILAKAPTANPYVAAMNEQGPIDGLGGTTATVDFQPEDPKAARLEEIKKNMAAFNAANRPYRAGA